MVFLLAGAVTLGGCARLGPPVTRNVDTLVRTIPTSRTTQETKTGVAWSGRNLTVWQEDTCFDGTVKVYDRVALTQRRSSGIAWDLIGGGIVLGLAVFSLVRASSLPGPVKADPTAPYEPEQVSPKKSAQDLGVALALPGTIWFGWGAIAAIRSLDSRKREGKIRTPALEKERQCNRRPAAGKMVLVKYRGTGNTVGAGDTDGQGNLGMDTLAEEIVTDLSGDPPAVLVSVGFGDDLASFLLPVPQMTVAGLAARKAQYRKQAAADAAHTARTALNRRDFRAATSQAERAVQIDGDNLGHQDLVSEIDCEAQANEAPESALQHLKAMQSVLGEEAKHSRACVLRGIEKLRPIVASRKAERLRAEAGRIQEEARIEAERLREEAVMERVEAIRSRIESGLDDEVFQHVLIEELRKREPCRKYTKRKRHRRAQRRACKVWKSAIRGKRSDRDLVIDYFCRNNFPEWFDDKRCGVYRFEISQDQCIRRVRAMCSW
jgi:hypothetical protein